MCSKQDEANITKPESTPVITSSVIDRISETINIIDTGPAKKILNISCICGHLLSKYDDISNIYRTGNILCDVCDKKLLQPEIVWHCATGKTTYHPGGYDVCDGCSQNI